MDGLTSTTVNPAPAAAPAPAPAPAPAMSTPAPMAQPTGSGKIADIFKRMNMIEVGFGVLGAAALYFTIYYYRYHMTMSKSLSTELANKVDELDIKVSDVQSALEREKAAPSGQVFI